MSQTTVAKSHYLRAWPLLAYAMLCYVLTGTVSGIMNVAAGFLEADRGWSATVLTSSLSIAALINVVTGFIAGRVASRHSTKPLCVVWAALYVAGLLCMGFSPNMGLFIVAMCVVNAVSSAWGYNTVPILITNWFPTRKGTVQGFVSMGILLGSVTPMIYTKVYNAFGAGVAVLPFVALAGVALLLLGLGVTDWPEQWGLAPDTLERCEVQPEHHAQASADGSAPDGVSRERARQILRDPSFLLTSLVLGIQMLYVGGIMVQLIPRLLELGFSIDGAALAMVATSLVACAGSFAFGILGDRLGVDVGVKLSFVLGAAAMVINVIPNRAATLVSLVLIAIVVGSADNWPVNVCAERFGREGFSTTFGVMQPIIQLVGAVGPAFFALIAGASGSYTVSYLAGAALMLFGLVAYSALTRR